MADIFLYHGFGPADVRDWPMGYGMLFVRLHCLQPYVVPSWCAPRAGFAPSEHRVYTYVAIHNSADWERQATAAAGGEAKACQQVLRGMGAGADGLQNPRVAVLPRPISLCRGQG